MLSGEEITAAAADRDVLVLVIYERRHQFADGRSRQPGDSEMMSLRTARGLRSYFVVRLCPDPDERVLESKVPIAPIQTTEQGPFRYAGELLVVDQPRLIR